jgi:curli biogenesis system outer membrane secretion channel CsgG
MKPLLSEGTMSKKHPAFLILIVLCFFAACGPTATVVNTGGPTIEEAQNVDASAKMRIAVSRFENKTQYSVGYGMTDMLVSALFRTNRFIVLERENLDVVMQEQDLSRSGAVSKQATVPSGEMEGASFLVLGAVTEFEPNQRGVNTPFGGVKQSHVAVDMRIVDARTSRIVASVTVEGKATDTAIGVGFLKWLGGIPMVMSLSAWNNTPMDKAIRICLDKAVDYIVNYSMGKGAGK